jgi:hypothetical protein
MVGLGAYTADAVGDPGHLFRRATYGELLKTTKFWDLEIGVGYIAIIIEEDFNFAVAL